MSGADVSATNFYERLGVSPDASREEIKLAYVEAVREYPPERHPDQFQRIREAFETLYDPESRTEYDATSSPAVEEALEAGQEALVEGNHEEAEAAFKRALVLEPEAHFIRNLLGVTHLHQEANADALKQFERLTEELPDNHLYWAHRATAEHGLERWSAAEEHYRRAIDLEPEESGAYQGLATLLADRERFEEAERLLERGIHADGVVDFEDISLFFELITLRLRQGDIDGIEEVTDRIESVITEPWQRTRVAYRFATLAQSLVEFQAFELALTLAETSERLAPGDEEIAEFTEYIRQNRTIIDQWQQLVKDNEVRDNLKAVYAIGIRDFFGTWETSAAREEAIDGIDDLVVNESKTAVVGHGKRRRLKDEIKYIEDVYPDIAGVYKEEFRNRLKQMSVAPTHVWLTCPYCAHQARAQDEGGRYTCPQCNNNFDYVPTSASVRKPSGSGEKQEGAQLKSCLISIVLGVIFLAIVGSC